MTDNSTRIDLRHIEEAALSHPFLRILLRDLPPAHSIWSKEQQQQWLALARDIFAMLYTESGEQSANCDQLVSWTKSKQV